MTGSTEDYAPHPHIGGRTAALRALAAWRGAAPGAPRVVVLTGSPGSGRSRLLTGFLMLCEPDFRKRLPLDEMDPSTVPPELPAPAVPAPDGLTAAQVLWLLADHYELNASSTEDVYAGLAALDEPVTVVVPDVDRAGPVRATGEPARLVREVLAPLAATETVRLLAEVPRPFAAELAAGLPPGAGRIIDLDEPEWADPEGMVLHAQAALNPDFGAPELPFTVDPAARLALAAAVARRAGTSPLVVQLAVNCALMAPEVFDPTDEGRLPTSVGEALDLHAARLGADPRTLRLMLAPLALAEADGIPVHLWARLASAVAGQDMSQALAGGMLLAAPFVQPKEQEGDGGRTLLRLLHPAIGDEIRAGLPNVRAAQTQIAMTLLETVPEQDWSKADPYVRDHIAGHTLEAGLLPQLLTDPGFVRVRRPGAAARGSRGRPSASTRRSGAYVSAYRPLADSHAGTHTGPRRPVGERVRRGPAAGFRSSGAPARPGSALADPVEHPPPRHQRSHHRHAPPPCRNPRAHRSPLGTHRHARRLPCGREQ